MKKQNTFWGGRFKKETNKEFFDFQKSIAFDQHLARYDIFHSLIHVEVLKKEGLLKADEAKKLIQNLRALLKDIEKGRFRPDSSSEDIHTDIYNKLRRRLPKIAAKLQTLRSRNDQVVFDEKLFLKEKAAEISKKVEKLCLTLEKKAKAEKNTPFIAYTHTQRAQIIYFSQYLKAWVEFFRADQKRLVLFGKNLKISLGAGSGSGVSLSQQYYYQALKKILKSDNAAYLSNSLHQVSDRDFLAEFIFILSLFQMHISRLCEDFILYSSREFDYLDLPEEFCTGSSIMPHKKNADFLELLRGNTALVFGYLNSILTLLKSLPLSYNRDLQLDKNILFSALQIVEPELNLLDIFLAKVKIKKKNILKVLISDQTLYATEIAEFLARKGVPFAQAHRIVGEIIVYAEARKINIFDIPASVWQKFHPSLKKSELRKFLEPSRILTRKRFNK